MLVSTVEEAETAALLFGLQCAIGVVHSRIVLENDRLSLIAKLHLGKKGQATAISFLEGIIPLL